jgi:lambda family phage portal protein
MNWFLPPFFQKKAATPEKKRIKIKAQARMFKNAKTSNVTLGWTSSLEKIDRVVAHSQRVLVARSRDAYSDNPIVVRYVKMMIRNVIGHTGFSLQLTHPSADVNALGERLYGQWGQKGYCDVTAQKTLLDILKSVLRSLLIDGEAFILEHDTLTGLRLELVDAQRCPASLMYQSSDQKTTIINGIEFDRLGKPLAYYFIKSTAPTTSYLHFASPAHYDRIPAHRVHHVYDEEFVGQRRGFPALSSTLGVLYQDNDYVDSAQAAARMAQKTTLLLEDTQTPAQIEDYGHQAGDAHVDDDGNPLSPTEAGDQAVEERTETIDFNEMGITTLPFGYKPHEFSPNYPSGEFSTFHKSMMQLAASGMDVPYALLANDGEGMNFSTMRQFEIDARESNKCLQQFMIDHVVQPLFEAWLDRLMLNPQNTLDAKTIESLKTYTHWQARRWAWVDPKKDAEATAINIRNLTMSPTQAIREAGNDPADVFAQLAKDHATFKGLGMEALFLKLFQQPDTVIINADAESETA